MRWSQALICSTAAITCALVWGCGGVEAEQVSSPKMAEGEGVLAFFLNDSTTVRIPGAKTGATLTLRNAEELLTLKSSDSLCYQVPVFNGRVCLDESGAGTWADILRTGDTPYEVPVRWEASPTPQADNWTDTLVWRLAFGAEDPWYGDLVVQKAASGALKGTVETATGDFRFLHGALRGDTLALQTFDGAHLFHFSATLAADSLHAGWFASGSHYGTPFVGWPKGPADAHLSEGQQAQWTGLPVTYAGKNLVASNQSWKWERGGDTVHVVSIMGSWCPNCMDEHRLLKQLLNDHSNVRVHTLAFERGTERDNGEKTALNRLKAYSEEMELWRYEGRWDITLVGPASKKEAQQRLPFLDKVVSFPTTVILHPQSDQPWVHSGFNGPATGAKFDLEKKRFYAAISGPSESR